MAAAISAINAKIRSQPVLSYLCSTRKYLTFKVMIKCAGVQPNLLFRTDFWGPASNFGIPLAAVMDVQKDPEMWVLLRCYGLGRLSFSKIQ